VVIPTIFLGFDRAPSDKRRVTAHAVRHDTGHRRAMGNPEQVAETRPHEGRVLDEEAKALFEQGTEHLAAGRAADALPCLRRAAERAPAHARVRSALGVALATVERDFEGARDLCESAVKQEFFNPDLYFNLARVYLTFGRRPEALRYLRRGQMIDPGHAGIARTLSKLGRRRLPVVPFLPRRHPLNRVFGSARKLILAPFGHR
jgi:tetratricopeptide (TPR) repeat protein